MREIAHAQKRNPLSDLDELLQDGRYPWRNHVGKFWFRSVKGFSCGGGSNCGLSHWHWSSSLQHSRTTVRECDIYEFQYRYQWYFETVIDIEYQWFLTVQLTSLVICELTCFFCGMLTNGSTWEMFPVDQFHYICAQSGRSWVGAIWHVPFVCWIAYSNVVSHLRHSTSTVLSENLPPDERHQSVSNL